MSGELKDYLLDPVVYPNWMWVLGLAIVVGVIGWILYSVWRWWTSRIGEVMELQTITDARRVHLALAGLMRALGTERTGRDLEVATVSEVRELVPVWPGLADILQACEVPSFTGDNIPQGQPSHEAVTRVLTMAVEAVNV